MHGTGSVIRCLRQGIHTAVTSKMPRPLDITTLIELPRPSGTPLPNNEATWALWPSTSFSFKTSRTTRSISLVPIGVSTKDPIATTTPRTILTDLSSTTCAWLDDDVFIYLRRTALPSQTIAALSDKAYKTTLAAVKENDPTVELWAKSASDGGEYLVGHLPVEPEELRSTILSDKEVLITFAAETYPGGDLYRHKEDQEKEEKAKRGSDIKVYDSLFVRHWDTWTSTAGVKKQVFYIKLTKDSKVPLNEVAKAVPESIYSLSSGEEDEDGFEHVQSKKSKDGRWRVETDAEHLSKHGEERASIFAPISDTDLECPVAPFGGASDFSFSAEHLVFHAKDPLVNPAWHTRTQVYLVPLHPRTKKEGKPRAITVGTRGACSSPVLSKDGKRVAWLEMREDGYEADKNRLVIYEIDSGKRWQALEKWDRSPKEVFWCPCGEKVFLSAEDQGHTKLYSLAVPLPKDAVAYEEAEPTRLTAKHSVSSVSPLSTSSILIAQNSLTSPNFLSIVTLGEAVKHLPVPSTLVAQSSATSPNFFSLVPTTSSSETADTPSTIHRLATLTPSLSSDLYLDAGEEFWFTGAQGREVHGFILFPPEARKAFKETGKRYPLAFLVHGGPQGAWTDSWSTRWNPNIYASAGYVTVAINPTGSTGYGQKFCDDIKNQWGGLPFQDLKAGLDFVKTAFQEIDPSRTTMLGASYGGFMANWIQGHNDIMGFKAIVCHDGVFSTSGTWFGTEELYFPEREFGGTPWEVPENYSRWNPQNFIHNWRTPQLVIHGSRDYRLTESEGVGVFNTLQRLGVPSRLLVFPSENHWVLSPHNGVRWHEEVLRWLDEWTAEGQDEKRQTVTPAGPAKAGYSVAYTS